MGTGHSLPPQSSRFQPGKSGNPNGRPRRNADEDLSVRSSQIAQAILEDGRRLIKVRQNGGEREVSVIEAILAAQTKSAFDGSSVAQRDKIDRFDRVERVERLEIEAEHATAQDYKHRMHEAREIARSRGEKFDEPLPNPDDIILVPGKRPIFAGPMTPEEVVEVERKRKLRDTLLLQDEFDSREYASQPNPSRHDRPGAALLLALQVDSVLPPRLRATKNDLTHHFLKLARYTRRELLKTLYREWRSLGYDIPRGKVFPPQRRAVNLLKLLRELDTNVRAKNVNLDNLGLGQFDATARAIFEKYGYAIY